MARGLLGVEQDHCKSCSDCIVYTSGPTNERERFHFEKEVQRFVGRRRTDRVEDATGAHRINPSASGCATVQLCPRALNGKSTLESDFVMLLPKPGSSKSPSKHGPSCSHNKNTTSALQESADVPSQLAAPVHQNKVNSSTLPKHLVTRPSWNFLYKNCSKRESKETSRKER